VSEFQGILGEFCFVHLQFGDLEMGVLLIARVVEEVDEVTPFEGAVDLLRQTESFGGGVDAFSHGREEPFKAIA
jgi:hypothetical protein